MAEHPDPHARPDLVVRFKREDLDAACAARGWSYGQLAQRARLSRPTVTAARCGRPLRPLTAWKIATALGEGSVPDELAQLVEGK